MTDVTQQEPQAGTVAAGGEDGADRINPWGVTLLVIAAAFFVAAAIALGNADLALNAGFDNAEGPRHDELAAIYYRSAAVLGSLGAVAIIVRLGAAAASWRPER